MDELKESSNGPFKREAELDIAHELSDAARTSAIDQPSLSDSLAAADMTFEPQAEPAPVVPQDDEAIVMGEVIDSFVRATDHLDMDVSTAKSTKLKESAEESAEDMPTDTTDAGFGETKDGKVAKEEHGRVEGGDEKPFMTMALDKPWILDLDRCQDQDSDMVEPLPGPLEDKTFGSDTTNPLDPSKVDDNMRTEAIEDDYDFAADAEASEPSDKDEMDLDIPKSEPKDAEDKGDAEEVETTISNVWSLPSIIDDGCEPQLSLEQLLIMSLVTSSTRTLSMEEICQWINGRFKYYKDLMFQHSLHPETTYNWMGILNDILHRYDFPTEPIWKADEAGEDRKIVFHLPPGREWHILPKPSKIKVRPFRFLDLPVDLRLMILEFALVRHLPKKHGWIIDPEYTTKRKENFRKAHRTPQRLKAVGPHKWELRTDTLDIVLAVLSWIRSLVLHYDPPIYGHACTRAFTVLREAKLRNLHLFLNEDKLIKRHELTRFSDPIPRLPGMKALAELRGLANVSINGPSARTKEFLSKIRDWKKNDSKDDDELMMEKREMEQEKFQAALKRSIKDLRQATRKKAADSLKAKHAREMEVQKRKKGQERKVRAEELAKEKKDKMEAREAKRKEREEEKAKSEQAKAARKVHKNDKKNIEDILAKKSGGKTGRAADEDTSSEDEESSKQERSLKEESELEAESEGDENVSLPPAKRAKTLPATAAPAAAKRRNVASKSTKSPMKPTPAPRSSIKKSATGVRSTITKGGIVAKGSSGTAKKAAPAPAPAKTTSVRKSASGSVKKNAKGKRKSDMASVSELKTLDDL
ncbi:hypothetical protein FKW77_010441 [Venturia effusa]|uniref:Fork-head domain-containing protein n=1 Tax=Venturia effusa TaxID=50376 RepID=A0A517L0H4_9PEZI|nr:hypothetical protein FKW77_010441 [Venturia effusa]